MALGAICSQLMVFHLVKIPVSFVQLLILFLTVLLIYWFDHWQDAKTIRKPAVSGRHAFFQRYRREMFRAMAGLFVVTGLLAVVSLPQNVVIFGILLACLSVVYLFLVKIAGEKKWILFQKENWIAIFFTAGIWGTVLVNTKLISLNHVVLSIIFGMIAFQNLLLFSYFEYEEDTEQQQRSIVRTLGRPKSLILFWFLEILILFFSGVAWGFAERKLSVIIIITQVVMSGILGGLFYYQAWAIRGQRYRFIGDAVFLLPVFTLFF